MKASRLLAAFLVGCLLTFGGLVAGIAYEQSQLRDDLCGLIVAVQPRTPSERSVSAYGNRIQDGSRTSGNRIGCKLPPLIPAARPTR